MGEKKHYKWTRYVISIYHSIYIFNTFSVVYPPRPSFRITFDSQLFDDDKRGKKEKRNEDDEPARHSIEVNQFILVTHIDRSRAHIATKINAEFH